MKTKSQSILFLLVCIILTIVVVTITILFVTKENDSIYCPTVDATHPSTIQPIKSSTSSYKYAAVASEDEACSEIGNDILARMRGNAVDASVATLLCNGLVHPHSSGIGGGAFFVIYDKKQGWHAIDGRETAPAAASRDMFVKKEDRKKSKHGGLSTATPGELKVMYEAHEKFGSLPWKTLVTPTYNLVKNGYRLNRWVQERVVKLKNRTGFEVFLDDDGRPLPVGSVIKDPKLTKTFETIRDDPLSFYTGDLAKEVVRDIQDAGGIITTDDLKDYRVVWKNTTKMDLPGGFTMHSMPPPGSGVVLSHILSILSGYNFDADCMETDENKILTYHRIVEAMKFAYGKRSALCDPAFEDLSDLVANMTSRSYGEATRQKITDDKTQDASHYDSYFYNTEDHGTNHLSVIDGEGNAVAVTSTVNLYFGSKVIGHRTGIVFNDIMDDFSTPGMTNQFGVPPSQVNFIEPGKRPLSSMTPTIVFDNNRQRVRMVVGAAGGTRITTSTAMLIMDALWFNMTVGVAMDLPRFHHQLLPNNLYVEPHFSSMLREGLKAKGHIVKIKNYVSICHAIDVSDMSVDASSDYRKGGKPAGY